MLSNPKWSHGTLRGLITWLESQPRDATYRFCNGGDCLIRRYMGEGDSRDWPSVEMRLIYHGLDEHKIALGTGHLDLQTYGEALDRTYQAIAA